MRLLLSVSVSIWIAGGCLLGCGSVGIGAESKLETIVAGESCHAKHAKQQPSKDVQSFAPAHRGMMQECPLVVNATAATSKNSGHVPDPGRGPVYAQPLIAKTTVQPNNSLVVAYLPNRGPTHLRCCVFLI